MNYLYDIHVTMLRIQYLCKFDHFCYTIELRFINDQPHDLTNLNVMYQAVLCTRSNQINVKEIIYGGTLEEIVDNCRIYFRNMVLNHVSNSVNKSLPTTLH